MIQHIWAFGWLIFDYQHSLLTTVVIIRKVLRFILLFKHQVQTFYTHWSTTIYTVQFLTLIVCYPTWVWPLMRLLVIFHFWQEYYEEFATYRLDTDVSKPLMAIVKRAQRMGRKKSIYLTEKSFNYCIRSGGQSRWPLLVTQTVIRLFAVKQKIIIIQPFGRTNTIEVI